NSPGCMHLRLKNGCRDVLSEKKNAHVAWHEAELSSPICALQILSFCPLRLPTCRLLGEQSMGSWSPGTYPFRALQSQLQVNRPKKDPPRGRMGMAGTNCDDLKLMA